MRFESIYDDDMFFIGVDPSTNSTGVCIMHLDKNGVIKTCNFYILKPDTHEKLKSGAEKSPLTKKELEAQAKYDNVDYIIYDKFRQDAEKSTIYNELHKTISYRSICEKLKEVIEEEIPLAGHVVCACQEGISYGSAMRSSAVFDLAGLNYMMRCTLMDICPSVYVTPPKIIKKFATGNGNADKKIMTEVFKMTFPDIDIPKIDDIADAYFMALFARHHWEQTGGWE